MSLALAAPHPTLWAVTLTLIAVGAVWIIRSGGSIEPLGVSIVAAAVGVLLAAAAFWALVKPEPTLRAMALSTASLLAFTAAIAVLHYQAATLARPLVDAELAAAEAALGFDWRGHVDALNAHPALARGLALAYHSSGPQIALVVISLSALGRVGRLWTFVRLFAVTLGIVIAVSTVFPAQGPYAFYAALELGPPRLETVGAIWHLQPLARLRAGEAQTLALADIRGLATFPSFHVCLAMITAWALAPIRIIGPLAVLLNAAVIVATISAGGHYLPDVVAGGLLGGAALAYVGLNARLRERRQDYVAAASTGDGAKSWGANSVAIRTPP